MTPSLGGRGRKRPGHLAGAVLMLAAIGVGIGAAVGPLVVDGFSQPRAVLSAAIVDPLSATIPNATFTREATRLLEEGGYRVDVYGGEATTVDFFRTLPSLGAEIVVLRAHSTVRRADSTVGIFTSEKIEKNSVKHIYEGLRDRIDRGSTDYDPGEVFVFTPSFVESSMQGRFPDSVVIMMGCQGLYEPSMAEAFVHRGARIFVGWGEDVTVRRMDSATIALLERLVETKLTSEDTIDALDGAMEAIGPDKVHGSRMRAWIRHDQGVDTARSSISST